MSPVTTAISSVGRIVRSFHPGAMPRLSRVHYRRELLAWLLLPVMMGAVEGGVSSVIAKNAFAGVVPATWLNLAVAVLSGAPAFCNITSFLWASLSHGRNKIRFLVGLQIAAVVLVAQVAFAPEGPAGLVMLMIAAVGARICWSGVVTIRSTVWRANYPQHVRAKMAGRLSSVQAIVLASVGLAIAFAMRADSNAFHTLYPIAAGVGLVGAIAYGRMRVRGHAALLNEERNARDGKRLGGALELFRILRDDPFYRRYMTWMFVFGIGNIAMTAPMVIMLRDRFGYEYLAGIMITTTIPILFMAASISIWARFFDRTHIVHFRVYHVWSFVAVNVAVLLASALGEPVWVWIAAVLMGIAYGGGILSWNLGHHDFAPLDRASQYMGVHVTLTGVRGLMAPLAAVGLYQVLESVRPGGGSGVFAICVALNLVGAAGFLHMARSMRKA